MQRRPTVFNVAALNIGKHILEEKKGSCLGWRWHLQIVLFFEGLG